MFWDQCCLLRHLADSETQPVAASNIMRTLHVSEQSYCWNSGQWREITSRLDLIFAEIAKKWLRYNVVVCVCNNACKLVRPPER